MPLESANFITELNINYPRASDFTSQGDDHIRLIKYVLKNTLPNIDGRSNITSAKLNTLDSHIQTVADGSTLGLRVTGITGNAMDITTTDVTMRLPLVLGSDPLTTSAVGNVSFNDARYYKRYDATDVDNTTYSASAVDTLVETLTDTAEALSVHTVSTDNPSGGKTNDIWFKVV